MISFVRRLYQAFLGDIMAIPGRAIVFFALLALSITPAFTQDPYVLLVLIYVNIFAIYAASWDLLAGFTGQFSMGHGAFFAVAGYAAAMLNINLGLPPWATIPLGAVAGVAAGMLIAIPAMRLRGIYFSLVSLSFPIILTGIVFALSDYTGGERGMVGISNLSTNRILVYYVSFAVMILCALAMWKFTDVRSSVIRTGLALRAISEDEISARCSGINTTRYKLVAFGVSAFFAGIAGGLYVHVIRIAGPSMLGLTWSFYPMIWTIFGGIGTIGGAVVGVYILYPFMELLKFIPELRMFLFACLIIVVIIFMPEGIAHWVRDKIEKTCPRCKLVNSANRAECRACGAPLKGDHKHGAPGFKNDKAK
jgi:branched-chain amino acid transport system permease protein